jgi:hypothetical protein
MRFLLLPAAVALLLAGCAPSRPTACFQADELRQRMAPLGDRASSDLKARLASLDASCRNGLAPSSSPREVACDSARTQQQHVDKLGAAASPEQLLLLQEVKGRCQSEAAEDRGFIQPNLPDDPASRAKRLRETP